MAVSIARREQNRFGETVSAARREIPGATLIVREQARTPRGTQSGHAEKDTQVVGYASYFTSSKIGYRLPKGEPPDMSRAPVSVPL